MSCCSGVRYDGASLGVIKEIVGHHVSSASVDLPKVFLCAYDCLKYKHNVTRYQPVTDASPSCSFCMHASMCKNYEFGTSSITYQTLELEVFLQAEPLTLILVLSSIHLLLCRISCQKWRASICKYYAMSQIWYHSSIFRSSVCWLLIAVWSHKAELWLKT